MTFEHSDEPETHTQRRSEIELTVVNVPDILESVLEAGDLLTPFDDHIMWIDSIDRRAVTPEMSDQLDQRREAIMEHRSIIHSTGLTDIKDFYPQRIKDLFDEKEALEVLATVDQLTELGNRRAYDERMQRIHAKSVRYGTPATMIMADIDHFKKVNDTYGHSVGDEVLKYVADLIKGSLRKEESGDVFRFGGEEIAVVLEEPLDKSSLVTIRIHQAFQKAQVETDQGIIIRPRISMGVAGIYDPRDSNYLRTPKEWQTAADQKLYEAKKDRNNFIVETG